MRATPVEKLRIPSVIRGQGLPAGRPM